MGEKNSHVPTLLNRCSKDGGFNRAALTLQTQAKSAESPSRGRPAAATRLCLFHPRRAWGEEEQKAALPIGRAGFGLGSSAAALLPAFCPAASSSFLPSILPRSGRDAHPRPPPQLVPGASVSFPGMMARKIIWEGSFGGRAGVAGRQSLYGPARATWVWARRSFFGQPRGRARGLGGSGPAAWPVSMPSTQIWRHSCGSATGEGRSQQGPI